MHYRQLMTLDIGNDALLCKVFSASLQGQALSWFHRLPPNSIDNFRDLSEAFVGQYLCSARHKQNISTLQNIKISSNEVFVQALHSSSRSLRSLPRQWNDLFRRASKYSMLKDDVRAATQQILVAGKTSRSGAERSSKLPDRPRPSVETGRAKSPRTATTHTAFHIIRETPPYDPRPIRLQVAEPLRADLAKRDHSKKCAYHKEHGHTTKTCRSLHYLVERLIKAGHLKQYLCSDARVRDTPQNRDSGTPRVLVAPKAIINYIHGGPLDEEYNSKRKRQRLLRAVSVRERVNSIWPEITGGGPRP
ncbi:hypothetical protein CK203_099075 [Vitis vinifera]|uniref:Retrotransposon gag domain-containing protein n=1 Tax=Vitis vinifera TaxID=29760 RepID=A0A438BTN1_VITVI|nr:hypothetical protein CK203_099075 [Vitis vinifera]